MKKILSFVFFLAYLTVSAQNKPNEIVSFPPADASPADILYYPINAAKTKTDGEEKPIIKVIYSRPQLKGRVIFGVLEEYGKVWRLGANENTEITFFERALIAGKKIKPGTYSLFAIPRKDKWTIILNKQINKWGAFTYDSTKDVLRAEVPVKALPKPLEYLSLTFVKTQLGANLEIGWDKTLVELPIDLP
ncbi:hypothetical protein ABIB40_000986 [Pedobacter sp. UYP30]|uniref:DUF2911 domain-containing protein n=1 Tax=Pedobacter sp. UYP30 TaxID=1756400 RepID=UPI0033935487